MTGERLALGERRQRPGVNGFQIRPSLPDVRSHSKPFCLSSMVAFQRTLTVTRPTPTTLIVLTFWLINMVGSVSYESESACFSSALTRFFSEPTRFVEGVIMNDGGGKVVLQDYRQGFLFDVLEQLVQSGYGAVAYNLGFLFIVSVLILEPVDGGSVGLRYCRTRMLSRGKEY